MSTPRMCLAVSIVVALASRAAADPAPENPCPDPGCYVKKGAVLVLPSGNALVVPPGYYLDEPTWSRRDAELKLAQDLNTRLKAENESFRKSADEIRWKAPVVAAGLGFIAGVVVMIAK